MILIEMTKTATVFVLRASYGDS